MKVASVCIDSPLPHLDRLFEYEVPDELAQQAVVGARVKVPFGFRRRQLDGYIVSLAPTASFEGQLQQLSKVVGRIPPLDAAVWRLARAVADRQAGIVSDVLRLAIPTRHARTETAWVKAHPEIALALSQEPADGQEHSTSGSPQRDVTSGSESAPTSDADTARRPARIHQRPHVGCDFMANGLVVSAWVTDVVERVRAQLARGRTTIVAVPDFRDVAQLAAALTERFPDETVARLDAGIDDDARYRSFLDSLAGCSRIIVGTRTAIYAPAPDLGEIILVDDGDPSFREPHAPYAHVRDVALIRQQQSGADLTFLAHSRSVALERLVEIGYVQAGPVPPHPHVIPAAAVWGDDPLLSAARIPEIAYAVARQALRSGPVLIQVARAGYQREVETEQGTRTLAGAGRTADELGRAFAEIPVIVATGDQVRDQVGDTPALVIATAGAEPRCRNGYQAVLLLDALSVVSREGLFASEDALRHWFNAAALAAPDGQVVLTGVDGRLARALITWSPEVFSSAELAERASLGFPPAVRFFSIVTDPGGTTRVLEGAQLPPEVQVLSTELEPGAPGEPDDEVTLLRVPYSAGEAAAKALKAAVVRASTGPAKRQHRLRVYADDLRRFITQ